MQSSNEVNSNSNTDESQSSLLGALQVLAATASNDQLRDRYTSRKSSGSGSSDATSFFKQKDPQDDDNGSSGSTSSIGSKAASSSSSSTSKRHNGKKANRRQNDSSARKQQSKGETSEDEVASGNSASGDEQQQKLNRSALRKGKWTVSSCVVIGCIARYNLTPRLVLIYMLCLVLMYLLHSTSTSFSYHSTHHHIGRRRRVHHQSHPLLLLRSNDPPRGQDPPRLSLWKTPMRSHANHQKVRASILSRQPYPSLVRQSTFL